LQPASCPLPQPHPGPVSVLGNEDHAGGFEGALDRGDIS
jgi:hypothetical protein